MTDPSLPGTPPPTPDVNTQPLNPAPTEPVGRRAFVGVRRQLNEEDLQGGGVPKLLLDDLERAEAQCEQLSACRDKFHAADKRASVAEEKLKVNKSIEIGFGAGIAIGGILIGLVPSVWNMPARSTIPVQRCS